MKICLLISDDPDDHMEFSEALYEISDDTVLVTVVNLEKAVDLLAQQNCIPEYIIINMHTASDVNILFGTLQKVPALKNIHVIAYGDSADHERLHSHPISTFINSNISYSQLRDVLRAILNP